MQINNEMADSIFLCDYLFIFSFKFTPPTRKYGFAHQRCFYTHTPFRNSGLSRDQFCHTLLGATVMEGAVKVTSGAAYSRWDPRLRGGQPTWLGKVPQRWFLPHLSAPFILEPQIKIWLCNYCCVQRLNSAMLITSRPVRCCGVCVTPAVRVP